MDDFKKKVVQSESFYNNFLNFDYKLAEFNYLTVKDSFYGELALELGPALGQMTSFLIKDFKSLHVVEGSEALLNLIPNYSNIVKHHSFFEDFSTDLKFDTIIMGHVLEHIYDPNLVLKKVKHWLSDSGRLIITVPNAKSIHRLVSVEMGLLKSEFELNERDLQLGHYRVYDLETLNKEIVNAGFNNIKQGGIFLKPLSNGQIEKNWDDLMIQGFFKISDKFPEFCAEIYIICTK
jgi:SAM-dependent methyltransferase